MSDCTFRIGSKKWKVPDGGKFDISIFGTGVTLYDIKDRCYMGCEANGLVYVKDGGAYQIREVKKEDFVVGQHPKKFTGKNLWWEAHKSVLADEKPEDPKGFLSWVNKRWKQVPDAEKVKWVNIAAKKNENPDMKDEDIPAEINDEPAAAAVAPIAPAATEGAKKRKEKEPKATSSRAAKKPKGDTAEVPPAETQAAAKVSSKKSSKKAPAPPPADDADSSSE